MKFRFAIITVLFTIIVVSYIVILAVLGINNFYYYSYFQNVERGGKLIEIKGIIQDHPYRKR